MKNSILSLALFASSVPLVHAATLIDFESPYTVGAVATATAGTTNKAFVGQQNWSDSTSTSGGNIITTTDSGLYTGGSQALTASITAADQTYIGAKAVGAITMTTLVFDFRYQSKELGLGGWYDTDNDSLFDQTEAQFMAGTVTPVSTNYFGVRGAGFGTKYSTGTSGTNGSWYRMTVTPDFANLQVTLAVFDLTTNSAVTLATSVFTLPSAQFGVNPTDYEGITARVTGNSGASAAIDNIQVIPEPTAALLGGLGMLSLLRRRRG